MSTENLNLDHNLKMLCLRALQKHRTFQPASLALGVSERTLGRWCRRWGIRKVDDRYILVQRNKVRP
jgi:hypothetical protein